MSKTGHQVDSTGHKAGSAALWQEVCGLRALLADTERLLTAAIDENYFGGYAMEQVAKELLANIKKELGHG